MLAGKVIWGEEFGVEICVPLKCEPAHWLVTNMLINRNVYIISFFQKVLLSDLPKAGQEGRIFVALRVKDIQSIFAITFFTLVSFCNFAQFILHAFFFVGGMEKAKSSVNCNSRKSVGQEHCLDHTHYCITGQQTRTSQHTTQAKCRLVSIHVVSWWLYFFPPPPPPSSWLWFLTHVYGEWDSYR